MIIIIIRRRRRRVWWWRWLNCLILMRLLLLLLRLVLLFTINIFSVFRSHLQVHQQQEKGVKLQQAIPRQCRPIIESCSFPIWTFIGGVHLLAAHKLLHQTAVADSGTITFTGQYRQMLFQVQWIV